MGHTLCRWAARCHHDTDALRRRTCVLLYCHGGVGAVVSRSAPCGAAVVGRSGSSGLEALMPSKAPAGGALPSACAVDSLCLAALVVLAIVVPVGAEASTGGERPPGDGGCRRSTGRRVARGWSAPAWRCRWTGATRAGRRSHLRWSGIWPADPTSGSGRCSSTRVDPATPGWRWSPAAAMPWTPRPAAASTSSAGTLGVPGAAPRSAALPTPPSGPASGRTSPCPPPARTSGATWPRPSSWRSGAAPATASCWPTSPPPTRSGTWTTCGGWWATAGSPSWASRPGRSSA